MKLRILLILFTASILAGCGQKGPLFIPENNQFAEHTPRTS